MDSSPLDVSRFFKIDVLKVSWFSKSIQIQKWKERFIVRHSVLVSLDKNIKKDYLNDINVTSFYLSDKQQHFWAIQINHTSNNSKVHGTQMNQHEKNLIKCLGSVNSNSVHSFSRNISQTRGKCLTFPIEKDSRHWSY